MLTRHAITKQAHHIGLVPSHAIRSRIRYQSERLGVMVEFLGSGNELERAIATDRIGEILQELRGLIPPKERVSSGITDEMVERARAYPVERLVDLTRGKGLAWCHDDKTPSLTYMNRTKLLWCAACDRYFNAIDVCITRDGMAFKDAVIFLDSGGGGW